MEDVARGRDRSLRHRVGRDLQLEHSLPAGSFDDLAYHYSLLRTIEDGFGISDHLGAAALVAPLDTIWGSPPP